MRVSIAVPAGQELVSFNICVWDMLRAIQQLVIIPKVEGQEVPNQVEFIFTRDPENKEVFEGEVVFFREEEGTIILKLDPPFNASITFAPPKGCNLTESCSWLLTEVAKLAYAMTHGEVFPDGIAEPVTLSSNNTFKMVFSHIGPDLTER